MLTVLIFPLLGTFVLGQGPDITATKGEVWPKPQNQKKSEDFYIIQPDNFFFQLSDVVECANLLENAFDRYSTIIATTIYPKRKKAVPETTVPTEANDRFLGQLDSLVVKLTEVCSGNDIVPALDNSEEYVLTVGTDGALLSASTVWGILRGLETFSQLIYHQDDALVINVTTITDFPRFPHRGIMVDTSRHYQPVSVILKILDAMVYNKMNVFHWHITDDHSFPYQSTTYPELSEKGAYHPTETIYDLNDIRTVVEYARVRGIRVIPEFDTPGHTKSWGLSHPELLTTCYDGDTPNGELGPMDPTKDTTYDFIKKLFTEVLEIFPDEYFHIGGDEVDSACWESNPDVTDFAEENGIESYSDLESYFIQNIVEILDQLNSKQLVWEDVFVNGVTLPKSAIVQVWREEDGLNTLQNAVEAGNYGLYSACWYFASLYFGADWPDFYSCEPLSEISDEEERKLVLGGEACMWGEYVNEYNIIPEMWPSGSAVAERLWSSEDVTDLQDAKRRLEEHACRMNKRGVAAQPPNGPGVCI